MGPLPLCEVAARSSLDAETPALKPEIESGRRSPSDPPLTRLLRVRPGRRGIRAAGRSPALPARARGGAGSLRPSSLRRAL